MRKYCPIKEHRKRDGVMNTSHTLNIVIKYIKFDFYFVDNFYIRCNEFGTCKIVWLICII